MLHSKFEALLTQTKLWKKEEDIYFINLWILTLTFKVQSANEEELRNTSSWILVSGLSTANLQETQ